MNLRNVTVTLSAIALGFSVSTKVANAASLSTSGVWSDLTGDVIVTGIDTSQLSWGQPSSLNPTGEPSSYRFAGVSKTVDINNLIDSNFRLGEFTHNNREILATGGFLTSAKLEVDLRIDTFSQVFSFNFAHSETINFNADGICPEGGMEPCPDVVSFPDSVSEQSITLDGVEHNLTLVGFSQDGGSTLVEAFLTLEQASNTAGLYARLTELEVPEEPAPSDTPPPPSDNPTLPNVSTPGKASLPEPVSSLGLMAIGSVAIAFKRCDSRGRGEEGRKKKGKG
ncbi:MAG: THxN family PEP-CTERM protein [Cyanobacteria bacterium J06636_16]